MFTDFIDLVSKNQFMSGGVVLIITGSLIALFRNLPLKFWTWFVSTITVSVEIVDNDESFQWIQMWLANHMKADTDISVYTKHDDELTDASKPVDNRPKIFFTPAPGVHWMLYAGRPTWVIRNRPENNSSNGGILASLSGSKRETIVIRILGRSRNLAQKLIEEARDVALPKDDKIDIRVSRVTWCGQWLLADRIRPRPFASVILDNNQHFAILDDIKTFLGNYKWYCDMGIPYRRGYLLYGSPGNGKTSLVVAVASALKMNMYVLNLTAHGMSDGKLSELLTSVSENSIILIEDIDCAFVKREKIEKDQEMLTFSGLLNALDGVSGKDGRIIVMTTNYIDSLDDALIREGRIDMKCYVDNAKQHQIRTLFRRFYPDADDLLVDGFVAKIPNGMLSMSKIQGYFMKYKDRPKDALENVNDILNIKLNIQDHAYDEEPLAKAV